MRALHAAVLLATAVAACSQTPGTVFTAADEATSLLLQTASEVFPSRSYELDIGGPTSAWCSEPDGSPDTTRLAVQQRLELTLLPEDRPVAMAVRIVDYWEDLGRAVTTEGWGTSSVAGVSQDGDRHSLGFTAIDHGDDTLDVLHLNAVTACYPRP